MRLFSTFVCLFVYPFSVSSITQQEAQLSLGWGRPYWLSLTLKVVQGR